MESVSPCSSCGTALRGRQLRFCSLRCKNLDTNNRHQNYGAQQARGLRRKRDLVARCGGACSRCGYARNLAALVWHHVSPEGKRFNLDLRALSNRSAAEVEHELAKCVLLCANCHAELHNPTLRLTDPTGPRH
jgi:hypothetical protein